MRLRGLVWGVIGMVCATVLGAAEKIDRRALVSRHNPHVTKVDPWAPLSVGNGQFCFTADVTGLQTFGDYYYKNGIPLETLARWAWHENANPKGFTLADANQPYVERGKTVSYPTNEKGEAGMWLRQNPHDMPLVQIGFVDERGLPLRLIDIANVEQTLDLWTGELRSVFTWKGELVEVSTVAATVGDGIAVKMSSRAIAKGALKVRVAFPRGHDGKVKNNPSLDWSEPKTHTTTLTGSRLSGKWAVQRVRDGFRYGMALDVTKEAMLLETGEAHALELRGKAGIETLELAGRFAPGEAPGAVQTWAEAQVAASKTWRAFWQSGAAVDFSGSTDPRAQELERRVVLSQYLTAIQFAGDFPPQESGLTNSTWYGKHHTEMVWWHGAHFAQWGRDEFLAKQLGAFVRALPKAREIASGRGLKGARWPKMVGPDWRESPGGNPLIIWNQPHPIHLAELLYRGTPTAETMATYRGLVQETAECMASMLQWDEVRKCYNLGPPLWIAQEIYDRATSKNPAYELSYWAWGLKAAQVWRERSGLKRDAEWDKMIAAIAPLPQKDGKYVAVESTPDTWDNLASRHDHPSFLMALGQLPGDGVDRAVMGRTLEAVLKTWDWATKIWGWDYPMVAMTAARLGEPKKAVDVLLKSDGPNNAYKPNGHNPQRGDLPVYLPGNGALLAAVALMAGGWDGAPTELGEAPGFPKDGTWMVRSEGLRKLP